MNLVAGATGIVGGAVCEGLRVQGKPVRALVRNSSDPDKAGHLEQLGAEIVRGELRDPASLEAACAGAATVVSGVTAISSMGAESITGTDRDGQLALVDAAAGAGVDHFIYISYVATIDTDDPLTNAKRAVEAHLRSSGVPYTILRPCYFMEAWLGQPLGWDFGAGTARILGTGEQRVSWISARDVVGAVLRCVDNADARGQTIELGGPEAVSPLEVARLAESTTGRPLALEHVPVEALEQQVRETAGTDASVFPSLMLAQTWGHETQPAPEWIRPQTTVADYVGSMLG